MAITVSISGKELKVEVDTGFSSLQSLPEEDAKSLELQTKEMEEPEIYSTQSGPQELTLVVRVGEREAEGKTTTGNNVWVLLKFRFILSFLLKSTFFVLSLWLGEGSLPGMKVLEGATMRLDEDGFWEIDFPERREE